MKKLIAAVCALGMCAAAAVPQTICAQEFEEMETSTHGGSSKNAADIVHFEDRKLEELILNDYQMKGGTHLGLYNVIRRLEMYFHDQIQISLHSDEGCGFEVFMEIRQNIQ